MVKNVFELLNEINNGNFDKLPEKIMVDDKIFYKNNDWQNYFSEVPGNGGYSLFDDITNPIDFLKLPIKEVKETKEKWKPKKNEYYWYVNTNGDIDDYSWNYDDADNFLYNTGNCFKTKEEAQKHLDNINIEIELRQLAKELNRGEKIDWKNGEQFKYYLTYDYEENNIYGAWDDTCKAVKNIYCLDEDFREKAIEKIGEERLKNYLKEE